LPPRKFALKNEKKDKAIFCDPELGPYFYGIRVSDNCNRGTVSSSSLGDAYANDTGRDGKTGLTGSQWFTVKEIEVFGIAG
jgi:hypothetical protein